MKLIMIAQDKRRRGRGIGRGGAKSGRGMKGQKSRAGYHRKAGFEGGQTPLYMRLPKGRGTKQKFPSQIISPTEVTTAHLNRFAAGTIIGRAQFAGQRLKLIGNTPVKHKLIVRVHATTKAAQQAVEAAGGKVELITT